jgi:hypothetical protein
MFIARQRLGEQVPTGTNKQATIEEFLAITMKTVFSIGSAPRLHNEDPRPAEGITEGVS